MGPALRPPVRIWTVFWVGAVLLGRVEGLRLLVTKKPMPRSIHQVRAATHLA